MDEPTEVRDQAVDVVREELRRLVWESHKTQKSIEKENGFTRSYLSQVLNGHMSLTARHIFGILFSLDVPPRSFFARLFPGEEEPVALGDIHQKMARYETAIRELEEKGLVTPEEEQDGAASSGEGGGSPAAEDESS